MISRYTLKIFDLSNLLLGAQWLCGAYWPSHQFPDHSRQYADAGRNQSQQHPACSRLTNRKMKVTNKCSFACLALDSSSLGNGTSNLLEVQPPSDLM